MASRPIEILMNEHRVIEQVLGCLEKMLERAERDGSLDGDSARQAADFFRTFADRCHHAKEEHQLFPALEARGMPAEGSPTAVMRYEHDQGRTAVAQMAETCESAAAGDRQALADWMSAARGYIELLRQHIQKEDQILFMMADRMLDSEAQQALLEQFQHVESHELEPGLHEKYVAVADELGKRFEVERRTSSPSTGGGCFGCGPF